MVSHAERSVDVAREGSEAVGTLASSKPLREALAKQEQLVGVLTRCLASHGPTDRPVALAACHALRLLCAPPGDDGPPSLPLRTARSEFRRAGGEMAVRGALSAHGTSIRSVAEGLLQHAAGAEQQGDAAPPPGKRGAQVVRARRRDEV